MGNIFNKFIKFKCINFSCNIRRQPVQLDNGFRDEWFSKDGSTASYVFNFERTMVMWKYNWKKNEVMSGSIFYKKEVNKLVYNDGKGYQDQHKPLGLTHQWNGSNQKKKNLLHFFGEIDVAYDVGLIQVPHLWSILYILGWIKVKWVRLSTCAGACCRLQFERQRGSGNYKAK